MYKLYFKIIFFLFIAELVYAEGADTLYYNGNYSVVLDSIKIKGNEITEDFIILRELTFEVGDTLTPKKLSFARERVYSLNIFNEVQLKLFNANGKNILLIEIEESWYIYPIPFVTLKDRDWDKISYGIAVKINNFRGRNETLRGVLALGYDPSLSFSYLNPNISSNLDLFFNYQMGFNQVNNKSLTAEELAGGSFEQKIYFAKVIFGNRFGSYQRLSLTVGFDYVETPFYIPGISVSNDRIDRTWIVGLSYVYDTRDLRQYARKGSFAFFIYEFKGLGFNDIDYKIGIADLRNYYRILDRLTIKGRMAARITRGNVPYNNYSFLGYSQRIRGHWEELSEGNDLYIGSLELNYWILDNYRLNLYWVPLLPKSLLSYRVGLVGELFADTGTTRLVGEPLTLKKFKTGYGTGLSLFFLPYFILRAELAFDESFNSQWIFDVGVSF